MSTDTPTTEQEQWVLRYGSTGPYIVDLQGIQLVRVVNPVDHQVEEAMREPARVYRVKAYPGVVEALKEARIALKAVNRIENPYPVPESAFVSGVIEQLESALSLVHPAQGDKG